MVASMGAPVSVPASPRDRSALVSLLLRRAEPLILLVLGMHVTIHALTVEAITVEAPTVDGARLALALAGCIAQVAGAMGVVRPGGDRAALARSLAAVLLLVVARAVTGDPTTELAPWIPVVACAYPLVLGLRRAIPVLCAIGPVLVVAVVPDHGPLASAARIVPVVLGALVVGIITDVMRESAAATIAAERRELRLRTSVDTAPVGIVTIDLDGAVTLVNAPIADLIDLPDAPEHVDDLFARTIPEDEPQARRLIDDACRGGHARAVLRLQPTVGEPRHVRVVAAPMRDESGAITGAAIALQDIHDEVDSRRRIEQFRTIADSTSDLVAIVGVRTARGYLNQSGRDFFGVEHLELHQLQHHIAPVHHERLLNEVLPTVSHGGAWSGEMDLLDRHGRARPTSAVVVGLFEEDRLEAFAVIHRDIAERKRLESRLAFEAGHDPLTGLPNRQRLFQTLAETLAAEAPVAVLFGDLDGFKLVNDSLGHAVGDQLLRSVAERLVDSARASDLVGRLGGDEFVVVCRGDEVDAVGASTIAKRFIEVIGRPIVIDGRRHVITMSMGIAVSSGAQTASELVQQADLAMYAAKHTGRGRAAVFDHEMRLRADERLDLEADLRAALVTGQIELHYQPIVHTSTGDVLGFETLARWNHPTRGMLMPKDFMNVVEGSGLGERFGEHVVREAVATTAMMRLVAPDLTVSVNMSRQQLLDARLVENTAAALADAALPASALSIEITEEMVMDELDAVRERLDSLRCLGVRFAIDDFGTGYSNLSMLRRFPADYVKIDRSLLEGEHELMRLVLSFTRELGFAAIAEGVETPEQLHALRQLGCHHAQGYFFAHPMTTAEAIAYLSDHHRQPA